MRKKLKIIALAALIIIISVTAYLWWALHPINSHGTIDLSQGKQNSQISKAVGGAEVGSYSKHLDLVKYPGVSEYELSRVRSIGGGNERDINFLIPASFNTVVSYYQNKLSSQPSIKTNTTNAFGDTAEPYQTAYFGLNPPHNNIQLNLIENKKTNTIDVSFREIL
jgi:hypothetical protein